MKKIIKIISRILLIIIVIILLVLAFMFIVPMTETKDKVTVEGSNNWMKDIDGSKYLNEIIVPGTHDSGSQYVDLAFFSKCQASSVYEQLNDGFRYLDIRVGLDQLNGVDTLSIWHGFCHCRLGSYPWSKKLLLENIIDDCYKFLTENPTETIIFTVKDERNGDKENIQSIFYDLIKDKLDSWYLASTIPTLDSVRGKIVLFRRYHDMLELGEKSGIELIWKDQKEANDDKDAVIYKDDNFDLVIQDRYKYDIDNKWKAFLDGLKVKSGTKDLSLHFLSTNGSITYGHPYKYAKSLNKKFLEYDFTDYEFGSTPWIIVDFSNPKLAEKIYSLNK